MDLVAEIYFGHRFEPDLLGHVDEHGDVDPVVGAQQQCLNQRPAERDLPNQGSAKCATCGWSSSRSSSSQLGDPPILAGHCGRHRDAPARLRPSFYAYLERLALASREPPKE